MRAAVAPPLTVSGIIVVVAVAVAIALSGCGGGRSTAAELGLQREDLTIVIRALRGVVGPVNAEVTATRRAWPLVANGLPVTRTGPGPGAVGLPASARATIAAAVAHAAALRTPPLFAEARSASLTGPGAGLAGLYRTYAGLAARGWRLIGAAIDEIEHGSPAGARFARANVALYIESVYDGHFDLAQLGKQLRTGYHKLGGAAAFGGALPQREVDALAGLFSEARDRLHPHVAVRLGS